MDWLRDTSYKNLLEGIAFFSLLLGLPTSGMGLVVVLPIGFLLIILKWGLSIYDNTQEQVRYLKNWEILRNKIIKISSERFFDVISALLSEIDLLKKPSKLGSNKYWKYLNNNSEIALRVYLLLLSFYEYDIHPSKRKIKDLALIGLRQLENSFEYVFQSFELTTENSSRSRLANALVHLSDVARIDTLLVLIEYIIKDFSYLRMDLMKILISRAEDFNYQQITKVLQLACYNYNQDFCLQQTKDFYLHRAKYFYGKAFDFSTKEFREDASMWLEKLVLDFVVDEKTFSISRNSRRLYFRYSDLNEESGLLLAIACRELGDYERALSAIEHVLLIKSGYLPAIIEIVTIYEMLNERRKARDILVKFRTQIASSTWVQNKLREYAIR